MDLLGAMREADREALAGMVADDVVFNSPATVYHGRDQVVDLLALVGKVLDDGLSATGQVESVTFVEGHLDGEELNGALVVTTDDGGRIAEITLLLRPLATLQAAVVRMARALAEGA